MPRFPRLVVPGYPHHVTQRGVRRQTTFFDDKDYQTYLRLAKSWLGNHDIKVWAYCLMPNHVHLIVVPGQVDSLSCFFSTLHQKYARLINAKRDWRGHLWQQRFFSVVMDEPHAVSAMRYVELNPVRSGLSRRPQDWPWSSARGNLGLARDPLIDTNKTRRIIADWAEYLSEREDEIILRDLRRQTSTGRPEGDKIFIESLESISGRRIRRNRAGRKPK